MKKTILFVLIIAIVATLCSCNVDAQDGIYSAIAASTEASSTKVKMYLGMYDGCYYVMTDEYITRYGSSTSGNNDFAPIPVTGDHLANEAALLSGGSILVREHEGSKVWKYKNTGYDTTTREDLGIVATALLSNGIICGYKSDDTTKTIKLFDYKDESNKKESIPITNFKSVLASGEYTLVETETDAINAINIYDKTITGAAVAGIPATGLTSNTLGFEATDNGFYIVNADGTVYMISRASQITKVTTISYTLPNNNVSTFHYTKDSKTYLVVKASENFIEIDITDSTDISSSNVTTGYGSIRQNLVVNILPTATTNEFIVATFANGVWKINAEDGSSPESILN